MASIAFFNGDYIPSDDLKISALDLSIHRGYGIFDYFVAEDGKIIWFDDYLDRFYASAKKAMLNVDYQRDELKEIIYKLISLNKKEKSGVKLVLTGGFSNDGYTTSGKTNLLIFILKFPKSNTDAHTKGVNLIMDEYMRPNPTIKTLNYFNSVLNQQKMKEYQAIDVLYHFNNIVYETSRSNIYLIKEGRVITKGDKVLEGVTRKNAMRVIQQNFPLELRDFSIDELLNADEVFITSSTKWILPVVKIEDAVISDGKVGPVSKQLIQAYEEEVTREKAQLETV
jgi:D-amino acid aminotransferase